MNFLQRFAYYLLGLLIGGVIVYGFWSNKETSSFCYLPNCRVLKDLRSKEFRISNNATLLTKSYSREEIKQFLTDGEVNFDKSKIPTEGGNLYTVEAVDKNGKNVVIEIINYTESVVLKDISIKKEK